MLTGTLEFEIARLSALAYYLPENIDNDTRDFKGVNTGFIFLILSVIN